ncbi:MAG: hypothetical protein IPH44_24030 [Myxococcales bacterium]|nr:hypothetical protein [Myxococcales bacterium]
MVVLGQSVDLILANALQRVDPNRNYVAMPCDDPPAASFDYGRWTAAVFRFDWLKPELPRIDYLSVGITHRGLCPRASPSATSPYGRLSCARCCRARGSRRSTTRSASTGP